MVAGKKMCKEVEVKQIIDDFIVISIFSSCSVTCCNQPSLSPSLSPPLSLTISPLSLLSSFRSFCLSDQSCCHRVARVLHTSNSKRTEKNIEKEQEGEDEP